MTAGELRNKFIKWFNSQPENKDSWIFPNPTGTAVFKKGSFVSYIPYGIPPPIPRQKDTGGGSDLIEFNPFRASVFYELKTKNDRMRISQKRFARASIKKGFKYYIVKEDGNFFKLILVNDDLSLIK